MGLRARQSELFMMAALVEVDAERVARYAGEHDVSSEVALAQLLEEAVATAERAGRDAVAAAKLKLIYTRGDIDEDRPDTVLAGAGFSGDREGANLAFDHWNEALAQRATLLRTYLRGEDVFREWIDDRFQKELEDGMPAERNRSSGT